MHRVTAISPGRENPVTMRVSIGHKDDVVSMERLQGWHHDSTGSHQERYFSQGEPTHLFRDGSVEGYDDRTGFPTTVSDSSPTPTSTGSPASHAGVAASPPAGWYPDPLDSNYQRVWDGSQWTDQTQPRSAPVALDPGPAAVTPGPSSEAGGDRESVPHFCVHCGAPLAEGAPVGEPSRSGAASQGGGDPYPLGPSKVPTNGHDSSVAQVDSWQTVQSATSGANGTVMMTAPAQPAPVPDPVPSPGWYPVQGAPEMVRWWDGSTWGDVRYTDPPTAQVPTPQVQQR